MILLLLTACGATSSDRYLAFVRGDDGYSVAPREIATLVDAVQMSGDLGVIEHGGTFVGDPNAADYAGGVALEVRFSVVDGVAVPADEDGLLLFTFYADLEDARAMAVAHEIDVDPIFPIDMAWNPAVDWQIEFAPADNAAYATGANTFVLLPDGGNRDVPILGNTGVIRHEFGHAIFHLLTVGDPHASPIVTDVNTEAADWQASLHEGFADSMAALSLDDAQFLSDSLDMPARHLDGDAVMESKLDPANVVAEASSDALSFYDPYPLGTVFASVAWDTRVSLDDPDAALDFLVRGVQAWDPAADLSGASFLDAWVAAANGPVQRQVLCAAITNRFTGYHIPEACG